MSIQTELHRHLDVSMRVSSLLKLAQERGLEAQSTSIDSFREKLILTQPLSDLGSVLAKFTLFQKVLDRPDVLSQAAFEVVEDCYLEGTRQAELRFSPSFVCQLSGLAWEDALDGFEEGIQRGLKKYPDMKAGMICIASRDLGYDSVHETVEYFLRHQDRFIGLDLAGDENGHPARDYEKAFKLAHARNANITVHAGEALGPDSIWEAVEILGAHRIGHGITCVQDPELMRYLAKKQICLEMCPTSNWLIKAIPSLAHHPLPEVLRAGVPVCINTDDPGIFGVDMPGEIEICRRVMGLTEEEILQCHAHANAASFLGSTIPANID